MVLCHSMNTVALVMGHLNPTLRKRICFELLVLEGSNDASTLDTSGRTITHIRATWKNFHELFL